VFTQASLRINNKVGALRRYVSVLLETTQGSVSRLLPAPRGTVMWGETLPLTLKSTGWKTRSRQSTVTVPLLGFTWSVDYSQYARFLGMGITLLGTGDAG